jgi:hypothetical protein
VKAFKEDTGWYSVQCPDGDGEDLRWDQLKPHLKKGQKTTTTTKQTTKQGHVGATKGMRQCLWERGLYFEYKENDLCKSERCLKKGLGCPMIDKVEKTDKHHRPHEFSMQHVLGQCRDFRE